ncbi:MAG: HEAT repeat domain-containing protein [Planctomycetia bacterium]|nr:HEAT repeat domain-containing protein [Planctomycetia bacterium]
MAISYRCPDCEFEGKAADDARGKEISCKGCGNAFTLPDGAAKNGAAAAKPTPAAGQIEAKCPNCMTKGKLPAAAHGKKVKCPRCAQMFTVGGEAPAPAPSGGPGAKLSDIGQPPEDQTEVVSEEVGLAPVDDDTTQAVVEVADVAILVEATCPGCQYTGNVPEKFQGKKVKCPKCAQMFLVGGATAPKGGATSGSKDGQWWNGQEGAAPGKPRPAPATVKRPATPAAAAPAPAAGDNPFAFDYDAPPAPKSTPKAKAEAPRPEPAARAADDDDEPSGKADSSRTTMIALLVVFAVVVGGGLLFAGAALVLSPEEGPHAKHAPSTEDLPHRQPNYVVGTSKGKTPETQPKTPVVEPPPMPKTDPPPMPKVDPEPQPQPKVDPEPIPDDKGPLRDDGGSGAVKFDNIHVNMTSIWVDHVKSPQGQTKNRYLLIQLAISNTDANAPLEYHSWGTAAAVPGKSAPARLSDSKGKSYRRPTPAELVIKPGGLIEQEMIPPGKNVIDTLIFEPPTGDAGSFRLDLPAVNLGKTGTLRLNLPGYLIVGGAPPPKGMDKAPPPPPDQPNKEQAAKLDAQRAKLKSRNRAERENAIRALGDMGPAATPALGDLIGILSRDPDEVVRAAAAEAIGKFGPAAKPAIGALIGALSQDYFRLKANAAEALGNIGPEAKDAIPHLKKLMASKEEEVPLKAAQALSKIDSKGPPPRKP